VGKITFTAQIFGYKHDQEKQVVIAEILNRMMQRKCSARACFIALGAVRALLYPMQCRQGMTLQLPIRRTTSYHFDPFSKYFNAHIMLSKTLG